MYSVILKILIFGCFTFSLPHLLAHPIEEMDAVRNVLKEFHSLTNDEAYVHIFSKRIMEPIPGRPSEFFGSNQRIHIIPFLEELVKTLPENAEIFDVGAGSGEVIDFALKNVPNKAVINLEEPNPFLIKLYLEKIKKYDNLQAGSSYEGYLQDYYQKEKGVLPEKPQDLILAIHMIYHLTDFTENSIDPEKDIIEAFSFLYEHLAPGGSIFIVYADLFPYETSGAIAGLAEKYFKAVYPDKPYSDHLISIYKARNKLMGPNGTIGDELLKRFPETTPRLLSKLCDSHFFGRSRADLAASALAAELCSSNNQPFEIEKLKFCLNSIFENPNYFGVQKEKQEVPQKGFWRANEPQVIAIISKGKN